MSDESIRKTANQLYSINKCADDKAVPTMGLAGKIVLISLLNFYGV